jgi:hypothetical protein
LTHRLSVDFLNRNFLKTPKLCQVYNKQLY